MGTNQRRKLPLHSDADLILSQRMCNKKQKIKKIKSKNNRNVASYLKACKLAIISLCHHNQELNRSTQASNNNIYKFSMGNLFFFPLSPRKNGFLVLRNSSIYSTEILKLLLKVIFNITFLQISVGGKKGKEIWPTQQQQHLKQSVSSGKCVFICCTDYISNKDAHRLQPWGEKPHETGTRQTNSKTTRKKRSCCQGVKAERVQGLRVCLRDSGGGKGGVK